MSTEIRIEGVEEVLEKFDSLMDEEKLIKALKKACALVERSAKIKAPKTEKSSGSLKDSIKYKGTYNDGVLQGVVYTTLEYAPYVEFGTGLFAEKGGRKDVPWVYQDDKGNYHTTSGHPPQPFMRPALNENREEIKRILSGGLKND